MQLAALFMACLSQAAELPGYHEYCPNDGLWQVAFGLDDGPNAHHYDIINHFDSYDAKATFFVNGNNFVSHSE
jgi:peptidoglycan/xylan/chitin deacetylase (PgdA/CDA1 family)